MPPGPGRHVTEAAQRAPEPRTAVLGNSGPLLPPQPTSQEITQPRLHGKSASQPEDQLLSGHENSVNCGSAGRCVLGHLGFIRNEDGRGGRAGCSRGSHREPAGAAGLKMWKRSPTNKFCPTLPPFLLLPVFYVAPPSLLEPATPAHLSVSD